MATELRIWLGRRIRELRDNKGWSQQVLADHAQMNREHLSDLENGKYEPTAGLLERIAKAMDVTLEQLFRGR
jgi:transcriptional regulator with XRE-family HTH domain